MDSVGRRQSSVLEASTSPLSRMQHFTASTGGSQNATGAQLRATFETLASVEPPLDPSDPNASKTIYDFQVLSCYHELYDLSQHKGSVVLICNVASKCKDYTEAGYTMLTKLYHKYRQEGFVVLAFPCNEFGNGEPQSEDEIAESISCVYPHIGEVDFPIMAKVEVNGDHASPLFTYLKSRIRGTVGQTAIKWNFTSFLCDQKGIPYARFAPGCTMAEIDVRIQELLHPKPPLPPAVPRPPLNPAQAAQTTSSAPNVSLSATIAPQSTASVAVAAATAPITYQDVASPDVHKGCVTPPPSEVDAPPLEKVSATGQSSPLREEETGLVPAYDNAGSSYTFLDATTRTVEGEDVPPAYPAAEPVPPQ